MKIEPYKTYKDSGVEWLGNVPEHWIVRRIKEVAYINKKALTDKTPNDYEFDYIDIGSVTYGIKGFSSELITFKNSPSRARRIVKRGDTIISTVRTYLKAIASIDNDVSDLIVSTGFAVVSPKKSIFSKYFSYWLTSNFIIDTICALSTGVSYPATNSSAIGDLFCFPPPFSEQKAIAHYLDTKTAQIDRKIDLLTQKAGLYRNLKQSLINETVTRGLDKSVPMKDSGVEWIGEVPEHWVVKRLKELLISGNLGMRIGPFGSSLKSEIMKSEGYKIYGQEHVISDNFKIGNKYIDEFKFKELQAYEILSNDILVTMMGTVGKSKVVPEDIERGIMDSHLIRIRIDNSMFIPHLLALSINESKYIHNQRKILTKGSIMEGLNSRIIKALNIIIPPLSEQKAIAHYLDTKTAQIDKIIQTINTQIEKLRELRKTLINDVVTGKIKVTE